MALGGSALEALADRMRPRRCRRSNDERDPARSVHRTDEHTSDAARGPHVACHCTPSFDDGLTIDATSCSLADTCPDGSTLAAVPACRATAVRALRERSAERVVLTLGGLEYRYDGPGVALLAAAARFVDSLGSSHDRLAAAATTDPLAVADELRSRTDPVADVAASSGLLERARSVESYADALTPDVALTIAHYTIDRSLAACTHLRDVRRLETGSEVRIYDRPDSVPLYALEPIETTLSAADLAVVNDGYEAIAEGIADGDHAASRALEQVTSESADPTLTAVLRKHTRGYGVLEDLFADPAVSDVYVTAPVADNPIRVVCNGESMTTTVSLTAAGGQSLASRVRRTSGRAFSRANPTVDATAELETGVDVRIAGVGEPVTEGVAFAFRERAEDRFTLPELVRNRTMTAEAAACLSIAIERNAAALIAGTRGAGKTTLLGTLLYELTPDTRTVVIEDTPELPVDSLQRADRDVQALRTGRVDGPEITPAEALRTALRLGDGALVVGEIRGEEARVLYEAMRVGANANAVLGTIHGDGADDVYERVVSDLEVAPSSFGVTDLVVTIQAFGTSSGTKRRLARIEEVCGQGGDTWFEPLYTFEGDRARPTGTHRSRGKSAVRPSGGPHGNVCGRSNGARGTNGATNCPRPGRSDGSGRGRSGVRQAPTRFERGRPR